MSRDQKNIPPILLRGISQSRLADLPDSPHLSNLIGPGVILVATAIGSGEIFFWPGITMKHGFSYIWLALLSVYLQHILNTEFARYTLATGESAVTGFTRLWKPFAWIFLICTTLPWVWPGWITGAATVFSWIIPLSGKTIAICLFLFIGISLSTSRVVYRIVEKLQIALTTYIILVIIFLFATFVRGNTLLAFGRGLLTFPTSLPNEISLPAFISAIAFAGAGGSINLAISNWIRDKGFGMGAHVPKVVSPITGMPISIASDGLFFEPTQQNLGRWKDWWRLTNKEQSITFLLVGSIGLILLMMISHSLLIGFALPIGMGIIEQEGKIIDQKLPDWGVLIFYLMVFAVFFTSAIGVIDHVGRVSADILKNNYSSIKNRRSKYFSESALYFYVIWILIAFGLVILLAANISDPPLLLSIAGALSGIVMSIYSVAIFVLNSRLAQEIDKLDRRFIGNNPFTITTWRKIAMIIAILFYGGLAISLVFNTFQVLAK